MSESEVSLVRLSYSPSSYANLPWLRMPEGVEGKESRGEEVRDAPCCDMPPAPLIVAPVDFSVACFPSSISPFSRSIYSQTHSSCILTGTAPPHLSGWGRALHYAECLLSMHLKMCLIFNFSLEVIDQHQAFM